MLRRSCKQVSLLLMQAQELRLPWRERLAMRLHLMACEACPRLVDQLALMRQASAQWRRYSESE